MHCTVFRDQVGNINVPEPGVVTGSGEACGKLECLIQRHRKLIFRHSADLRNRPEGDFCQWADG